MGVSKVRAPRGFYFRVTTHLTGPSLFHRIELVKKCPSRDRMIGSVRLRQSYYHLGFWETHSNLQDKYQGKGWGALLYARAIQYALENNLKVKSSGYSSDMAENVWRGNTIRKYFHIVRKPTKTDPEFSTWFAYKKRS